MRFAFLSYSRTNDKSCDGKIRQLLAKVQNELQQLTGDDSARVFVDAEDAEFGQIWRVCINSGLDEAVVLIPVISPHYLNSAECRREYNAFTEKETTILARPGWKRTDRLILPLLFRPVGAEFKQDPIWLDCKQILFEQIDHLTSSGTRLNSRSVDAFVRLIASRINTLWQLVIETYQGEKRFAKFRASDALNIALQKFTEPLAAWRSTLSNGTWVDRKQLRDLISVVESNLTSTRFLIGPPGCGKSAILARLCAEFVRIGYPVLGIKADKLPTEIETLSEFSSLVIGDDGNLVSELRRLAVHQKTVVIIDQLDALANLADLESGRLNAMLDLIAQLRDCDGIHVIASMRAYELEADQRLTGLVNPDLNLDSETVRLDGLTPEQVLESLAGFGIDASKWPPDFLTFLATPYHLSVFTQHLHQFMPVVAGAVPDATLFSSIQAIHSAKFRVTLECSANRVRLEKTVDELVKRVQTTESLWQRAKELSPETLTSLVELEQLGWICQQGDQIAFAHQTQYEFLLGRQFVNDPDSFVQYIADRQDGLFVRPTVWHGLALLRAVAEKSYTVAMSQLLARDLRRHLSRLLMEFLAEVGNPHPAEVEWVSAFLGSPNSTATMCWLLRGKADWFDALDADVFEKMMTQGSDKAWPVTRLIETSWPFRSPRTVEVLRTHWVFRREFAHHMWWILSNATEFSDEMITWLLFSANECPSGDSWFVHRSVKSLSEHNPEAAYRLLAVILNRRLELNLQTVSDDNDSDGNSAEDLERSRQERFANVEKYAEREMGRGEWHDIGEMAAKAPAIFVRIIWPWFERTILLLPVRGSSWLPIYRDEAANHSWLSDGTRAGSELVMAILASLKSWAAESRTEFLQFVVERSHVDSRTAHRLFAQALVTIAGQEQAFILGYFRNDVRRFRLGQYQREDTVSLINAVLPHWNRTQVNEFQKVILDWHTHRDAREPEYIDGYRAGLLQLVPVPLRLYESAEMVLRHQADIQEERRQMIELADLNMKPIKPAIDADAMARSTNEDLLAAIHNVVPEVADPAFTLYHNAATWTLAEEFGKFAAAHPERARLLLPQLNPIRHEWLAGAAIRDIGNSSGNVENLYQLIQNLHQVGYFGQSFRDDAGHALRKAAISEHGLPDDICQLLSHWLLDAPIRNVPSEVEDEHRIKQHQSREPASILWPCPGLLMNFPNEWFWIGEAIKLGYCLREDELTTSGSQEWIGIFRKCIQRDFPSRVWQAWLFEMLRYVPERESAAQLVSEILRARADVLQTDIGVCAVARFSNWMPAEDRAFFSAKLFQSQQQRMQQGSGELAVLLHLRFGDQSASEILNRALNLQIMDADLEPVRLGIAFACANLWREPEFRDEAIALLSRQMPTDSENVNDAILQAHSIVQKHWQTMPPRKDCWNRFLKEFSSGKCEILIH